MGSRWVVLFVVSSLVACGGGKAVNPPSDEPWRIRGSGRIEVLERTSRDTIRCELEESTVHLVKSQRQVADTVWFSFASGIGMKCSTGRRAQGQTEEIAPGWGFFHSRLGRRDSVYMAAGALQFRGSGNDVFLGGTVSLEGDTTRFQHITREAEWRMARLPDDNRPDLVALLRKLLSR